MNELIKNPSFWGGSLYIICATIAGTYEILVFEQICMEHLVSTEKNLAFARDH